VATPRKLVPRNASDLVSRAILASRAGITFGGARDLYEALGYKRTLLLKDFRDRYERGGIAGAVVDAFPNATWRAGAELIEDEDPEVSTQFEEVWTELEQRLQVWSVFSRADIIAGLGRYSVVLIGAPGELNTPLPTTLTAENIVYLQPFAEQDAEILTYDEDPESERFGLPELYRIKRTLSSTLAIRQRQFAKDCHWSRCLHIADGLLDDRVFGQPRLARVWNDLDNLEKVIGGGSEAFWLRAHQGIHFNIDPETQLDTTEAQAMKDAADELVHGFRRTMATRGTELKVLGSDVANFNNPADAILTVIAGATRIPKRILTGSEQGELASSQDESNWNTRVGDRRKQFAEPRIVRPFVDLLIKLAALPKPLQYNVRWPETDVLDDTERASIATQWAGLNTKTGDTVVTAAEIRDHILKLGPLTEEQLAEEEEKKAAKLQEQQEAMQQAAELAKQTGEKKEPPKPGKPPQPPEPIKPPQFKTPKAARGKVRPRRDRGHDGSSGSPTNTGGGSRG